MVKKKRHTNHKMPILHVCSLIIYTLMYICRYFCFRYNNEIWIRFYITKLLQNVRFYEWLFFVSNLHLLTFSFNYFSNSFNCDYQYLGYFFFFTFKTFSFFPCFLNFGFWFPRHFSKSALKYQRERGENWKKTILKFRDKRISPRIRCQTMYFIKYQYTRQNIIRVPRTMK